MDMQEIHERRAAKGLTQKALCALAGVHPTTYSALMRPGSGRWPSTRTLKKLADALERAPRPEAAE